MPKASTVGSLLTAYISWCRIWWGRFEFNDIIVSDQYVQKLFDRYIDPLILNFNEDEMMNNFIDLEEKPLFPDQEAKSKETALLTQNRQSVKDLKNTLGSKFSGLKQMTRGKLANMGKKLKAAKLAISLNESKREAISMDIQTMLQKFYDQNDKKEIDMSEYKPQDKYGMVNFKLSQVSPMMQVLIERENYKKMFEGSRNFFGVVSNKILNGKSADQLSIEFDK